MLSCLYLKQLAAEAGKAEESAATAMPNCTTYSYASTSVGG